MSNINDRLSQMNLFPISKIKVIKTVRLRLDDVKEFLQDRTLKIIVLHRDPRGVMNSRGSKKWCSKYLTTKSTENLTNSDHCIGGSHHGAC